MTVREIVKEYLEKNGYDGLYNEDEDGCGCELDDFMHCSGEKDIQKCIPAFLHKEEQELLFGMVL